MRILQAYNEQRSGGGATAVAKQTVEMSRQYGLDIDLFMRNSRDLPSGIAGHIQAGTHAFFGRSVGEFAAKLDEFKPDIVHVHEVFPLLSPWIIKECSRRGIPVVMSIYDYLLTCPARNHFDGAVCTRCADGSEYWAVLKNCRDNVAESVMMALYGTMIRKLRLYLDHVSEYIVPSPFTRQWLIDHAHVKPEHITAIAPVVNAPAVPADPVNGKYASLGGRIVPEKGIDILFEAGRRSGVPVYLSRNEHHFVTVDLPPGVELIVTRSREELDAFYRASRMVVMPSIWFETFGIVAGEAMSYGIPVIASRIGALENLIEDGTNGLLVEPGDVDALANAMHRVWTDDELCRSLGSAGREKAQRSWGSDHHFRELIAVYERALVR